jgi:hypothetical protein
VGGRAAAESASGEHQHRQGWDAKRQINVNFRAIRGAVARLAWAICRVGCAARAGAAQCVFRFGVVGAKP